MSDKKSEQKQSSFFELERESQQCLKNSSSSLQSQYFEEYGLNVFQYQFQEILIKYEETLEKNNIIYSPLCFQPEVSIVKIHATRYSSVVTYFVSFSHFSFYVNLLHLSEQSLFRDQIKEFGKGSYGSVHLINLYGQNVAIKNINLNPNTQNNISKQNVKIIQNAIVQVCMTKLFFTFGVGPQLNDIFGFDLLVFQNSVVFAMEVCQKPKKEFLNTLYDSISLMHSFGIVHGDVKPENIMWSPSLQKNVFIDFGLSRVVKEKPGQKTYTGFFGTFEHSYIQMKNLLIESSKGYVDLFYNDLFGVKSSLDKCEIQKNQRNHMKSSVNTYLRRIIENIKLFFYFYLKKTKEIKELPSIFSKDFYFVDFFIALITELDPLQDQMMVLEQFTQEMLKFQRNNKPLKIQKVKFSDQLSRLAHDVQSIKQFKGALSNSMIFSFLFLNIDSTPFIVLERQKLILEVKRNFDPKEKESWLNLMRLFLNTYIQEYTFEYIFNSIAKKVDYPSIRIEFYDDTNVLLTKVRLFVKYCLEKYGFNLFEINEIVRQQKNCRNLIEQDEYKSIISGHPQLCQQIQIIRQCELQIVDKEKNDSEYYKIKLFRKYLKNVTLEKTKVKLPQIFQNFLKEDTKQISNIIIQQQNQLLLFQMNQLKILYQFSVVMNKTIIGAQIKNILLIENYHRTLFNLQINLLMHLLKQDLNMKIAIFKGQMSTEQLLQYNAQMFVRNYGNVASKEYFESFFIKIVLSIISDFFQIEQKEKIILFYIQKIMLQLMDKVILCKLNQKNFLKKIFVILFKLQNGGQYFQKFGLFKQFIHNFKETLTSNVEKISFNCLEIILVEKYSIQSLKKPTNLALLQKTIEMIKSVETEQQINKIFSLEEVIIFLKIITLSHKANPPFEIDFLIEKVLYHPRSDATLQIHIIETILYYNCSFPDWDQRTIDLIEKFLMMDKIYYGFSQKNQNKYYVLSHSTFIMEWVFDQKHSSIQRFKNKILGLLKQIVKSLSQNFNALKGNYLFFISLLFKIHISKFARLEPQQIQNLFKMANILIPFADYYLRKGFEADMKFWCFQLLNISIDNTKKRSFNLKKFRLSRATKQNYMRGAVVWNDQFYDWIYDPKQKRHSVSAKNKIKHKMQRLEHYKESDIERECKMGKNYVGIKVKDLSKYLPLKLRNPFPMFYYISHELKEQIL